MGNIVMTYKERFLTEHTQRRRLQRVILSLALLVTVGVFWQLHFTGIAQSNTVYCGLTEHTHTESCYSSVLACGLEESEDYTTEAVYETQTVLTCTLAESAGHTHSDSCYNEDGALTCTETESAGHTHTDACYSSEEVLVTAAKTVSGHTHTDACYESQLVCTVEEHTHTAACLSNDTADVETAADWKATLPEELSGNYAEDVVAIAQSQLGYTESTANFILSDDGTTRKGYTRYGAWYGLPYGDWCAMFVSFCLNYAGVPEEDFPEAAGVYAWIEALKELEIYAEAEDYTPRAGDIIFFDSNSDGKADHVGIVEALELDEDGEITTIYTIEGNYSNAVVENEYEPDDAIIVGYGILPEAVETFTQTCEGEDYTVTVIYTADAEIPEEAILMVEEYATDSDTYQERLAEALELGALDEESGADFRLFEIGFYVDGEEIEPATEVQVVITYTTEDGEEITATVIHYGANGTELVDAHATTEGNTQTITYSAGGFSDYGVATAATTSNSASYSFGSGNNRKTCTVYAYDTSGNNLGISLSTTSGNSTSLTISTLTGYVTLGTSGDYTYSYATVKFGSSGTTYGSSSNSVVSISYTTSSSSGGGGGPSSSSSTTYTITYADGSTESVSSSSTPYIYLYYTGSASSSGSYTASASSTFGDNWNEDLMGVSDGKTQDDYISANVDQDNGTDGTDSHLHYYHIDIRMDSGFSYVWMEGKMKVVSGTTVTIEKNWITSTTTSKQEVTFDVYVQTTDEDGNTVWSKIYWDYESYLAGNYVQTTETTCDITSGGMNATTTTYNNYAITITLNEDNNWTASVEDLEPGNYMIVESTTLEGYETTVYYFTKDDEGNSKEGNDYTYLGTIQISGVQWVEYTMDGNADAACIYYFGGEYSNYAYTDDDGNYLAYAASSDYSGTYTGDGSNIAHIDGDYYGDPDESSTGNNGDYEFFLDYVTNSSKTANQNGGRGLVYLTDNSTIWVCVDYTVTYVNENGETVTETRTGAVIELTPEYWIENNLCNENTSDYLLTCNRGIDLSITGDMFLNDMGVESIETEILAEVWNVAKDATTTTILTGTKTWKDITATNHTNSSEITLLVYSSTDNTTWTQLDSNSYVVKWNETSGRYYIGASYDAETGDFVGLPSNNSDGDVLYYKVEEQAVSGYATDTSTTTSSDSSYFYETSYNFTNTDSSEFEPPTIDKSVSKADADIGEVVCYTITTVVPAALSDETDVWTFTFVDVSSEGVYMLWDGLYDENGDTIYPAVTVTIEDVDYTVGDASEADWTVANTDVKENKDGTCTETLTLTLTNVQYYLGKTIKLTVYGYLTEDAELGANGENTNSVYLEYKCGDHEGTTDTDTVYVFTYGLSATKVDATDDSSPLAGASFYLYKLVDSVTYYYTVNDEYATQWVTDKSKATLFTSNSDGQLVGENEYGDVEITGLASGTYYLTEVTAPDGYNRLTEDVVITISATYAQEQGSDNDIVGVNTLTYTVNGEAVESADGTFTIDNYPGVTLPSAGGAGTTLYTMMGLMLLSVASCLMYIHSRRREEESS